MDFVGMEENLARFDELEAMEKDLTDSEHGPSILDQTKEASPEEYKALMGKLKEIALEKVSLAGKVRAACEALVSRVSVKNDDVFKAMKRTAGNMSDSETEEQVHALEHKAIGDKPTKKGKRSRELIARIWKEKIIAHKVNVFEIFNVAQLLRAVSDPRQVDRRKTGGKREVSRAEIEVIRSLLPNVGK